MAEPGGVTGRGYERIHGFVEAVALGTLTLESDDGRTMTIDVSNSRGNVATSGPATS